MATWLAWKKMVEKDFAVAQLIEVYIMIWSARFVVDTRKGRTMKWSSEKSADE